MRAPGASPRWPWPAWDTATQLVRTELRGRPRFCFLAPLREFAHYRRNIWLRSKLGHQLFDLSFGLVRRTSENRLSIGLRHVRHKLREAAQVDTLLQIFRARHQHLAIVLDEYGGTAGVATLEDLLEEIFGEVSDPFDRDIEIQSLPDGSTLVNGLTTIADVNEHFGLKLSDPHYDTIAGFILGQLGRLAELGDDVVVEGARLRVVAMDGRRVSRVWIFPAAPAERQPAE